MREQASRKMAGIDEHDSPRLSGYAAAALISLLALLSNIFLLDPKTPFLPCLLAIVVTAWLCGRGPGWLSALLCLAGTSYFLFVPWKFTDDVQFWPKVARESLFFGLSVVLVSIVSSLRRAGALAQKRGDVLIGALSNLDSAVIGLDSGQQITFMNEVAHRLTGWGKDALGKPIDDVLKLQDPVNGQALELRSAESQSDSGKRRAALVSKTGGRAIVEDVSWIIREAISGSERILVFRDITANDRTERELRSTAERCTLALDVGKLLVWEWDLQTGHLKADELRKSRSPTEVRNRDGFLQLVHPDDRDLVHSALQKAIETHSTFDCECRVPEVNGSVEWLHARGLIFFDNAGKAVRMLGVCSNITERKLVEGIVREGHEQFRNVAESATDGFISIDERGRIVYVNSAMGAMFGYTRASLIGQSVELLVPTGALDSYRREFQRYVASGRPDADWSRLEFSARRADGSEIGVELSLSEFRTAHKRLVTAIVRDVTQRKRAEREAGEIRERLVLAQHIAGLGIYEVNLHDRSARMSPESEALYGMKPGGFGGTMEKWVELVHPEDRQRVRTEIEAGVRSGAAEFGFEYRVLWPDGSIHWIANRARVIRGTTGEVERMFGAERDITAQKATEHEREDLLQKEKSAHARLALAQGAAGIGTYERNLSTNQISMSAELEALLGLPPDSFPGTYAAFLERLHPDDRALAVRAYDDAIARKSEYYCEYRVIWPDGSIHWLGSRGRVLADDKGRAEALIGAGVDISKRKAFESERELVIARESAARSEAERASRLKDEFLATVSHELRTPLTSIVGWSKILLEGHLDAATARRGLESIDRNGKAQAKLVEDLLDVSRIITGKMKINAEPMQVEESVAQAVEAIRQAAVARRITLELALTPGRISGDRGRVRQIAFNLLSNAVKFSQTGGRIEVRTESTADTVKFVVRDYGKGIDPNFLPRIFHRFSLEDASSTRSYGGMGLSLAVVRHLVELHGGSIAAVSAGAGTGATMTVEFPLLKVGDSVALKRPSGTFRLPREPNEALKLRGVQALLLDDDEDTRSMIAVALRQAGAATAEARDTAQAFDLFVRGRPDVLIFDINIDGQPEGIELLQRIRKLPAEIGGRTPALAVTGLSSAEDMLRLRQAGFDSTIRKPLVPQELVDAIALELETPKLEPAHPGDGGGEGVTQ